MKTAINQLVCISLLLPVFGCIQQATLVEVNPDGSGQIVVRFLFSERGNVPTFNFGGSAAKQKDNGSDASEEKTLPWTEKEIAKVRQQLDDFAKQFGEGVTLTKTEPIKKQGWAGIQATYAFKDVNKVRLISGGPATKSAAGKKEKNAVATAQKPVPIRFQFKRGAVSELTIHLAKQPASQTPGKTDPFEDAGLELKSAANDLGSAVGAGIVKAALQDARVSTMVKVNGKVIECDALYRPRPESLVLLDFEFGKFVNSDRFERVVAEKWDMERMFQEKVPGLRGQQPGDTVRVRFQAGSNN